MPSKTRTYLVGLVAISSLAACSNAATPAPPQLSRASGGAAAEVATFEGSFDPETGKLSFKTLAAGDAADRVGRSIFQPYTDNQPGGPVNTFELKNGAAIGTGTACDGAASWGANVVLTHFFSGVTFSSVMVELTELLPAGREACNSAGATDGMSAFYGLWDYGSDASPMVAGVAVPLPWYFKQTDAGAFTFKGRIMATLAPLAEPVNGPTAFEWAPAMFMDPPHSFKPVGTTVSHVVFDGSAFVSRVGSINFQQVGSPLPTNVGLVYPRQSYAYSFSAGNYFIADAAHGGSSVDTTGDFTVCAKFKPGANPGLGVFKVIVARGDPVSADPSSGWALAHFGPLNTGEEPEYSFMHRTGTEGLSVRSIYGPQGLAYSPALRSYEYVCGGRNAGNVQVGAFGQVTGTAYAVTASVSNLLPLVIGAASGGAHPYADGGVYEVIFDSRPASLAVMNEIVAAAEGRRTYNGAAALGSIFPPVGTQVGTTVIGADLATYVLPQGANHPLSTDASGLLDSASGPSDYNKFPTFGGTSAGLGPVLPAGTTSYCIGAEVTAASWSTATGCVLGGAGGGLLGIFFTNGTIAGTNGGAYRALASPVPSTGRHKVMVCYSPPALPNEGQAHLYVDDILAGSTSGLDGNAPFDIVAGQLQVGTCNLAGPLTGARIGRVFACPSADPLLCN